MSKVSRRQNIIQLDYSFHLSILITIKFEEKMSSREDAHKAKSVREFMDRENIKSLGVNDLKKVTDVPCYISKNAANALTFIVNIVFSICYGYYGVGGSQTYEQISQKYQVCLLVSTCRYSRVFSYLIYEF